MFDVSDDAKEERILFVILVGVVFGAALGLIVLQDTTEGILTGVVTGIIAALIFPAWIEQFFERVPRLSEA